MANGNLIDSRYMKFYESLLEKANEYNYFIFMSRKCYFYTKIVIESRKNGKRLPVDKLNVQELRDRDILKEMDFSIFESGKKVLLIDDTLYTGKTLERIIERIESKVNNPDISIAVFAMIPDALPLFFDDSTFQKYDRMCAEVFTYAQMAEFVVKELQAIQESRHSYVIDLPVFEEVQMSLEKFEKLIRESNAGWGFTDYKVKILNASYDNGFFTYENKYLKNVLGEDLLSLVVKCRYEKVTSGDGEIKVFCRFTPFAMLRSMDYQKGWDYFKALFQETDFLEYMQKKKEGIGEKDDYVTLYRSIVYILSFFVGKMFENYVKNLTDTTIELKNNLSQIGMNDEFSKSIHDVFQDFSITKFYGRLPMPHEENNEDGESTLPDLQDIETWFMGWLSMCKRDSLYRDEKAFGVTIEEIENSLKNEYEFSGRRQLEKSLVCIILKALDTGVLSNSVQREDNRIVRCFKLGESSNILFEHDLRVFYAAVYSYYNCVRMSAEKYKECYGEFLRTLENYLSGNEYFKSKYITKEAFCYFSGYFDIEGKALHREIANKRYVLCANLHKEKKYIRDVMQFVYRQRYL